MKKQIYNYGIDVDKETLEQFKNCYSEDFVVAAALMPDAHLGYAAPIGAVLKTKRFVVPACVGFDIGCGLIAIKIKSEGLVGKIRENQNKIYSQVMKKIPMGVGNYNEIKNITEKTKKTFKDLLEKFEKKPHDRNILNYLKTGAIKQIGTLGGGNHFIELGSEEKQWNDKNAASAVASVVRESTSIEGNFKSAIALGGGHYCPDFTKLVLRTEWALGHICPEHALSFLDSEMLQKAIDATFPKPEAIVIDWKGLGKEKQRIVEMLSKQELPVLRVQKLLH